jgi:hypothetical protein
MTDASAEDMFAVARRGAAMNEPNPACQLRPEAHVTDPSTLAKMHRDKLFIDSTDLADGPA